MEKYSLKMPTNHPLGYNSEPHVCTSVAALRRCLAGNEYMLDDAIELMREWGAVVLTKSGLSIDVIGARKG